MPGAAYAPHVEHDPGSGTATWYDASGNIIAVIDSPNRRLSVPSGSTLLVSGSQVLNTATDGTVVSLGTDGDIALVERASILDANTTLTNVIVGTPVTPAVAADSLILANKTADGDVLMAVQTGGNTHAFLWMDASAKILRLYSGDGVEVAKFDSAAVTITGTLTATGAISGPKAVAAVTADGAITLAARKTFFITKAGVAAMTLADPTATTHDGYEMEFIAASANAHTLDNSAGSGFFSSGGATKDIATFGGAIGDRIRVIAYQGKWYIADSLNITLG